MAWSLAAGLYAGGAPHLMLEAAVDRAAPRLVACVPVLLGADAVGDDDQAFLRARNVAIAELGVIQVGSAITASIARSPANTKGGCGRTMTTSGSTFSR